MESLSAFETESIKKPENNSHKTKLCEKNAQNQNIVVWVNNSKKKTVKTEKKHEKVPETQKNA